MPVTLSIADSNANTVTVDVSVLAYGSVHQGGYVFAIDDTTADTGGVGGKIAALTDQSTSAAWGSSAIGGIDEHSTVTSTSCDGKSDGACNTARIRAVAGANFSDHAASLCTVTIEGRTDWYLPAICELGYDGAKFGAGCATLSAPEAQNMASNLVDRNYGNLVGTGYWSSTESGTFQGAAWRRVPTRNTTSVYTSAESVRCARALTP